MPAKKNPKAYTQKQLQDFSRSLRAVADRVDACAIAMQTEKIQSVEVTSWRSGETAVRHWQSFSRSVHSAVDVAILNKSIG